MRADAGERVRGVLAIALVFASAKLALHLGTNLFAGYGYFRDELYYLACADHPAAGYVDHPPLSILLLIAGRVAFGTSLFGLRLIPAVAGAATVFVTGLLARELGGGRRAVAFACAASLLSLHTLAVDGIWSMNAFDVLVWVLAPLLLVRALRAPSPGRWIALGAVLGLGLENKIGVLWLCAGLGVGVAATSARRVLRGRWPYAAAALAGLLFLPYVWWNATHDFAHLAFIRNAVAGKYAGLSPWDFVAGQVLMPNPATIPIWIAGLVSSFRRRDRPAARALGVAFLVVFALLLVNGHSKPEYLAPGYGMLFALGGVAFERMASARLRRPAVVAVSAMLAGGIVFVPFVLPVLPVETFIAYERAIGIAPTTYEDLRLSALPQFYADMFGWENQVRAVAKAYRSLPPAERRACAIYGDNYGRCGAVDFFGPRHGLPRSIGGHNSYFLWGPRGYDGSTVIMLRRDARDLRIRFARVDSVGVVRSPYVLPYETDLAVWVCRGLRTPLAELWPAVRHYE